MNISRRELFAAGGASASTMLTSSIIDANADPAAVADAVRPIAANLPIRDYLSLEAAKITNRALDEYKDAADWRKRIGEKRRQYMEMMGLADLAPYEKRPAVPVHVTGTVERKGYRIEKLYYESLPNL